MLQGSNMNFFKIQHAIKYDSDEIYYELLELYQSKFHHNIPLMKDYSSNHLLLIVARHGNIRFGIILVALGCDPNLRNSANMSPFDLALLYRSEQLIYWFLSLPQLNMSDVNRRNPSKYILELSTKFIKELQFGIPVKPVEVPKLSIQAPRFDEQVGTQNLTPAFAIHASGRRIALASTQTTLPKKSKLRRRRRRFSLCTII